MYLKVFIALHIFEMFILKSMVENFGGKITVETQEGVGSSFSVSFAKEK